MPLNDPRYIFGIHDSGGEQPMEEKGKKGWILFTERIFCDPNDHHGRDYRPWSDRGFGIIARLNHDYAPGGTIPRQQHYDDFAQRVGNFARNSQGCHTWIIGNEMNFSIERPRGEPITPSIYAECFGLCRFRIRSNPGHQDDRVVIGAVAPWNAQTSYPGNENGDWIAYFADLLELLHRGCDGIALHTYTHGIDPNLVFSEGKMNPPYHDRHYHFRAYRDFMHAIPQGMHHLPVYITETNQNGPWSNVNSGWVRNAYSEIAEWNDTPGNQQIRCLILYRWSTDDQWTLQGKGKVLDDWRMAMEHEYVWHDRPTPPPTGLTEAEVAVIARRVTVGLLHEMVDGLE